MCSITRSDTIMGGTPPSFNFSRPETSHTPHRACAITNQNVSVPWFITQPLNEIIKLVMSQHFTYYDLWMKKKKCLCVTLRPRRHLYSQMCTPKGLFLARRPLLESIGENALVEHIQEGFLSSKTHIIEQMLHFRAREPRSLSCFMHKVVFLKCFCVFLWGRANKIQGCKKKKSQAEMLWSVSQTPNIKLIVLLPLWTPMTHKSGKQLFCCSFPSLIFC